MHFLSTSLKQDAYCAARVAIWNRNKIILVIVMGAWLTNVGFLIHSKYGLLITWN